MGGGGIMGESLAWREAKTGVYEWQAGGVGS